MTSSSNRFSALVVLMLTVCVMAPASGAQPSNSSPPAAKAQKGTKVAEWFSKYDLIRKRAQMSPAEKESSGRLLTQGIAASVFKTADSEQDQQAAKNLLKKMVDRYTKAQAEIDALQPISETKKLQQGYKKYFCDAQNLFADYLKIQGNLFATDASGNSILGQLQQRKGALEALDVVNKDLDAKLRDKYSIAAFPY